MQVGNSRYPLLGLNHFARDPDHLEMLRPQVWVSLISSMPRKANLLFQGLCSTEDGTKEKFWSNVSRYYLKGKGFLDQFVPKEKTGTSCGVVQESLKGKIG